MKLNILNKRKKEKKKEKIYIFNKYKMDKIREQERDI
jgi:hypothetical protein